jgi:hypothetical protein
MEDPDWRLPAGSTPELAGFNLADVLDAAKHTWTTTVADHITSEEHAALLRMAGITHDVLDINGTGYIIDRLDNNHE